MVERKTTLPGRVFDIRKKRFLLPSEIPERLRRFVGRRPRAPRVFDAQLRRFLTEDEIRRRGGLRRIISFKPPTVPTVTTEVTEIRAIPTAIPFGLSPKVRAIKAIEAAPDGLIGARLQRLESLKADFARDRARIESQNRVLGLQQRNLSKELTLFRQDQERLRRLSDAGQLTQAQADRSNRLAATLTKKVESLNKQVDQATATVDKFNEGIQSITNIEESAGVSAGKDVKSIVAKPVPTVPIEVETFVRPTFAGEVLFPDDTRATIIEAKPITEVAKDIEIGIQTGLEIGVAGAFDVGQAILGVTPAPVKQVATKVLEKDIVFLNLLLGDLGVAETRRRIVPTAAAVAETVSVFLPGPVGKARAVQAAAAFGDPFDLAAGVAVGGVSKLARSGSQFLKLIGGTGRAAPLLKVGEKAIAKGLFPALIGVQAGVSGFEFIEAKGEPEAIRRIGRETAGGLGAFVTGAQIGGALGTQFFSPFEASLARQVAARQLKPGEQKRFERFFNLSKEIDKVKRTPGNFNLSTERLTSKEARIVTKFLQENTQVIDFGSTSLISQLPKNIAKKIKPADVDVAADDFVGVAEALVARLRAAGVQRVSLITSSSGAKITIRGKKAIEVKPLSRLKANIATVRGPFELPSQSFTKTADGVSILKLGPQAKRQAIAGALEDPQLRQKDLIRLEQIAGILTPQQALALRKAPKAPLLTQAERDFRALIGDPRGELFPRLTPVRGIRFIDEAIISEVRPRRPAPSRERRRPRTEFESLIGVETRPPRVPIVPSRLPPKQVGSALPAADFSRLIGVEPTRPSRLPTRRLPRDSILPRVPRVQELLFGPSRLRPVRRPPTAPSRLRAVSDIDLLSFLPPVSRPRRVPPSRLPPTAPIDVLTFDPLKPVEPEPGIRVLPPGLPTFETLLGTRRPRRKPFNVFIKTRVKGKSKFRRANRRPLTRGSALGLGSDFVDRGVERSFFIQPSKKRVMPKSIPEFENAFNPFKFRSPRRRSKLPKESFVERSGFAIDTIGELQGITFKGLAALERNRRVRRALNIPIRRRKRKVKRKRKR